MTLDNQECLKLVIFIFGTVINCTIYTTYTTKFRRRRNTRNELLSDRQLTTYDISIISIINIHVNILTTTSRHRF